MVNVRKLWLWDKGEVNCIIGFKKYRHEWAGNSGKPIVLWWSRVWAMAQIKGVICASYLSLLFAGRQSVPSLFFGSSPKQRAPGRMYLFSWCQCQKLQAYLEKQRNGELIAGSSIPPRILLPLLCPLPLADQHTPKTQAAPPFLALCSPIAAQDIFIYIQCS